MNSLTRLCPRKLVINNFKSMSSSIQAKSIDLFLSISELYLLTDICIRNMSAESTSIMPENYPFKTLKVSSPAPFVCHVELNRPEKRNAINDLMWR